MSLKQMQILDSTEAVKQERPAPCARHCEANAFKIVIKNLKAQLAQPEQEPVAWADLNALSEQINSVNCGTVYRLPSKEENRQPLYTKEQL